MNEQLAAMVHDLNSIHAGYEWLEKGYDELITNAATEAERRTSQVLLAKRAMELATIDWDNRYAVLRNTLAGWGHTDDSIGAFIADHVFAPTW